MALRFTLRQLEYLVAVGEAGSIAAASHKVNVSSPSISAAISQLEVEFGVQLFVRRHAQGLSLTPGGQRIFNEARRILHAAAALNDLAGDITDQPRGPLTVGCLVTIAPFLSASLRRSFEGAHPDARVTLREAHQGQLLAMLRRAEIDVAITYDMDVPGDTSFTALVHLPPLVILPAGHRLAGNDSVALAEVVGEPLVLLDLPNSRDYFLSLFHAAGLRPNIAERTADLAVVRSLVANGFGYGLINIRPLSDVAPDGGRLAYVPLAGDHRAIALGLITMRSDLKSRVLRAFEEHAQGVIRAGGVPGMAPFR